MKFLKLFALLLISISSFGQKYYSNVVTPLHWHDGKFDTLHIPYADTIVSGDRSAGQVVIKPSDKVLYRWDGTKWGALGSGGSGGSNYTLPQADSVTLGGIRYNTDLALDGNNRLGIAQGKKDLWNQIALLPFYSTTLQMRGEIRDSLTNHDITFNPTWFNRDGNYIDFISPPFIEKDSIFTNSPAASLTADNLSDINDITDTSIHPTTTYVRSLFGAIKKDTILFNRAHFYKDADSVVGLKIRKINGQNLYGDTSNIVIAGGSGATLPNNGDSSFYLGGDTTLHRLPVAPATSDSIDYAFTAMTTVYNEAGPGEYAVSANGLTANKDNFNFPFRQLKSLNIGAWTDGDYISFTNGTISSSTNFTFVRAFIRLKSVVPVGETISFAFYYNGTLVSKTISCVNYGLDKNKVGVYQNISIPISAFGFTANNFDELRLKFGGTQSDGIYMDLVQFQNASPFENTFITDQFKKPGTDSVFIVVGGINKFVYRDSAGGSGTDNTAYHTITTLSDSTGFTLNRPNGTKDTIQIAIPAPIDTTNKFVNNIYKLPNDANIYFKIGSTTYSIKDSVGSASGGGSGGLDTSAIHKTGDETVASGIKTFAQSVTIPAGGSKFVAPNRITPSFSTSATSDTLIGLYLNPTFGTASTKKYALYSTTDLFVNGIRIGGGGNPTDQTNTAIGKDALNTITSGSTAGQTAVGFSVLKNATNASNSNTGTGYSALSSITTGTANTANGYNSMYGTTGTVGSNTALGAYSLGQTTGSNNVALGHSAGRNAGSNGIYIGYQAGANDTRSNQLYIANNNATGTIYGDLSTGQVVINARTTPSQGALISAAQFQVNSNALITNRGSIPAPRMPQAQRDLIAVQQGVLTDVLLTFNGGGCTGATTAVISGGGGSGATATMSFSGGQQYISITAGGSGYDPATTTVTFSGGGCSTAPTGVPIIGAQGLSVYCIDCTATDGTRGVLQYYNGSSTSPWKNAW